MTASIQLWSHNLSSPHLLANMDYVGTQLFCYLPLLFISNTPLHVIVSSSSLSSSLLLSHAKQATLKQKYRSHSLPWPIVLPQCFGAWLAKYYWTAPLNVWKICLLMTVVRSRWRSYRHIKTQSPPRILILNATYAAFILFVVTTNNKLTW